MTSHILPLGATMIETMDHQARQTSHGCSTCACLWLTQIVCVCVCWGSFSASLYACFCRAKRKRVVADNTIPRGAWWAEETGQPAARRALLLPLLLLPATLRGVVYVR